MTHEDSMPEETPAPPKGAVPSMNSTINPEANPTPAELRGLKEIVYVLAAVMVVAVVSLIVQFILNSAMAYQEFNVQMAEQTAKIDALILQLNACYVEGKG